MKNIKYIIAAGIFLTGCLGLSFSSTSFSAQAGTKDSLICSVYITGIGCGNCAVTDPVLFTEFTKKYPNLVIIEYEIYKLRESNQKIEERYFKTYLPQRSPGIPFILLGEEKNSVGGPAVVNFDKVIGKVAYNACPLPNGRKIGVKELDIAGLPGKAKIWTKNRVLISGETGDSETLRKLIVTDDISEALKGINFEKAEPEAVPISNGKIEFEHAVKVDDWRIQWNGEPLKVAKSFTEILKTYNWWIFGGLVLAGLLVLFLRMMKSEADAPKEYRGRLKVKAGLVTGSVLIIMLLFGFSQNFDPDFLKTAGQKMPLLLFTVFIALIDGFNPCNIFVLVCLLTILISGTGFKKRLYIVAFSFVAMVFIIYFCFMVAWLNVFKWISFVNPLRIGIAIIALAAGAINCKELFFFKKGVSLTIQDEHRGILMARMRKIRNVINKGSFPFLVVSSIGLAGLASLIELPCTAGFPIIYTGILANRFLENSFNYYFYIGVYNLVYVMPLVVIISIFLYTMRTKQITEWQVQIIKFIGGVIMIILGLILLINPQLVGLGVR